MIVDLYLLRHGKAENSAGDRGSDAERALTSGGREEITEISGWIASRGYTFDCIATSPLKRARETAEIVASALERRNDFVVWHDLEPGGELDSVCTKIKECDENGAVLIIGHEPLLSRLISRVIARNERTAITLGKGGLAKIRNVTFHPRLSGELHWLLTPRQIRRMR